MLDSPWLSLGGMIVAMVLVIGGAYWFTRHVVGGQAFRSLSGLGKHEDLRLLVQLRLGKDQSVAVVQAGQRYFLVGLTPQSISLLAELSPEEAAQWIPAPAPTDGVQPPTFRQAFVENLKKKR